MDSALRRLVDNLEGLRAADLHDPLFVAQSVQRRIEDLVCELTEADAADGTYRRTLLYRNDRFELVCLDWGARAATPVHDHANQACAVVVIDGCVAIDDFVLHDARLPQGLYPVAMVSSRETITAGMTDVRKKEYDLHRVRCNERARTIHVYAHPIDTCGVYDPETSQRVQMTLKYDAVYNAAMLAERKSR